MSLSQIDRRLGELIRDHASRAGVDGLGRAAASTLSPAFRVLVAVWLTRRATRVTGGVALGASITAALAARRLRDRIGRPRPGGRSEGGLPSRHAAAATAIARTAWRHRRGGPLVGSAAGVGLLGRVVSGDHDPLDILAGAALGAIVEGALSGALAPITRRLPAGR